MTLADLNVRVSFLNDLKKGLGGIERDLRRASGNFAKAGNEMALSLSLPLAAFGVKAVQTAAQMESLKLAMRTTFQDAGRSIEAADKELEALRKSAMAPGLDFEQAVKASIRLQNVGLSAEKARATIEQMANAISMSGGTAEDLDGVSIQMAQMISKGKVLAQDLRIIQERMPKITSLMQDAFGVSTADAMQEMGVSGVEFVEKITAEMQKLPRVSGGLANSIVNMGAAVKTFLAQIGEDIATTFDLKTKFEEFGSWLQGVATWFKGLSASTKEWILYVGAAVIAIGPLIKVMAGIGGLAGQLVSFMGGLVGVLKGVAGAAISAANAFQAMSMAQKATLVGLGIAILVAAAALWNKYSDSVDAATESQRRVESAISATQTEIGKEQIQANLLFGTLKDLSKSTNERAAALDTLKSKYPSYLEGLSIEKSSLTDIEKAQRLVNEQIVRSVALRMKAVAQEETAMKIASKMTRINEIKGGAQFTPGEGWGVGVMDIAKHGSAAAGVVAKMQREVDLLNGELVNLDKQFEKTFNTQRSGESVVSTEMLDKYYNPETPTKKGATAGGEKTKAPKKEKEKDAKTTVSVLQELEKAYASASVRAEAFGSTYDANAERASALQSAIIALLDMGLKPTDAAVAPLIERYRNLNTELTNLPASMTGITSMTVPLLETTTQMANAAHNVSAAFENMGLAMSEALMGASESMKAMAASGETSFKALGRAALKGAADVLRAKIIEGVAAVVADSLSKFGVLGLAIAGGAGAAAGVLFNKVIKGLKIPAFADGGMVTSPTMAMFGEYPGAKQNPEFALRQDQLQGLLNKAATNGGGGQMQVYGTIKASGRDLLVVIEQAQMDKYRRSGS